MAVMADAGPSSQTLEAAIADDGPLSSSEFPQQCKAIGCKALPCFFLNVVLVMQQLSTDVLLLPMEGTSCLAIFKIGPWAA
ncbi:hypothetical protein D0962_14050 [Leptolyngbyaceae cyanobacterium CCMR0082]|uniref:Uncharacterized protein n=1 Tax=Adonisia turfae CCMR0082 TaxID=2304604 RepID=A0A6M0S683_9CYAN|nr:hypothetical protein [Adonisia turfae]NEZ63896.1 hypothetical protein [Adonisia turfae CCMR0082]